MAQQFLQAGRHQLQKSADSKNCAQSAGGWPMGWPLVPSPLFGRPCRLACAQQRLALPGPVFECSIGAPASELSLRFGIRESSDIRPSAV